MIIHGTRKAKSVCGALSKVREDLGISASGREDERAGRAVGVRGVCARARKEDARDRTCQVRAKEGWELGGGEIAPGEEEQFELGDEVLRGESCETAPPIEAGGKLTQEGVSHKAGVRAVARNVQRGLSARNAIHMPADVAEHVRRTLFLASPIPNGAGVIDGKIERFSFPPAALRVRMGLRADGTAYISRGVLAMCQEVSEARGSGGGVEEGVKSAGDSVPEGEGKVIE